ncbi:Ankyrin repeat family protein [Brugia pahangi]
MIVILFKILENFFIHKWNEHFMSHQPIRVVQPPIQPSSVHSRSSRNYQSSNSARYDDLVQIAEQQRRLIDANRQMIHERETRGNHIDNAPIRLAVLRNEILFEEREMTRLKMIERETQQTINRRMIAERQLNDLKINYTSQEQHLRNVISKITSLQTQLDKLRRRRLIALNAAREQQQKLMNSPIRPKYTDSMQKLSVMPTLATTSTDNIISRNDIDGSKSSTLITTEQSVSHSNHNSDNEMLRQIPLISDSGRSRNSSFDLPYRPRASVEPFQVNRSKPFIDARSELSSSCPPQLLNKPFNVSTFGKDRANFTFIDRNSSPSPPKDPYPTVENTFDNKITKLDERRTFDTLDHCLNKKLSSSAIEVMEKQQQQNNNTTNSSSNSTAIVQDEQLALNLVDNTKLTRADQISIRPDTLRAAKRRSWAIQENTSCNETEYIRKILLDEQKKGRTHLLVGCNIGNLFTVINKNATTICKPEIIHEEEKETTDDDTTTTAPEYVCELLMKDIQLDELPVEIEQMEECKQMKVLTEKEFTDEIEMQKETSNITNLIKTSPEKGILCHNKVKKAARKVVFDPLALLLDAALEGEMDLVKSSAAKLSNISACNDEGITALHNAICAGHYEIVRYLVDSFADVNAQDSDGWTPLHCAASCNNLPMVKLLVENGACIFAQTLSDLETPAEKCEEDEDGYEGCQLYLKAANQEAGIINNGFMYAAYDYDKMQDDELSFSIGSCLRVLEKDTNDHAWWFCEITTTEICDNGSEISKRGLVPRNYLSLYPSLSKRSANFQMFDLSQLPRIHDSKNDNIDVKEWRTSNSVIEKITEKNDDEAIVEQTLPITVS